MKRIEQPSGTDDKLIRCQAPAAGDGIGGISAGRKASLCSLFKRKKQKTLMQYLLDYRFMMVKEGLQHGGSSISQVCYEYGFRNVPYFNRTFKNYVHDSQGI